MVTARDVLQRTIEEAAAKLAALETLGDDVYEDGDVLLFDLAREGMGPLRYAALKVNGKWYLTGTVRRHAMTWDELTSWLTQRRTPTRELWLVTSTCGRGDAVGQRAERSRYLRVEPETVLDHSEGTIVVVISADASDFETPGTL